MGALQEKSKKKELKNQELISLKEAQSRRFVLAGHEVIVYSAGDSSLIDPTDQYVHARGDNHYTHFVDMGKLLEAFALSDSEIPWQERWNSSKVPEGFVVRDFDTEATSKTELAQHLDGIENMDVKYGLLGWLDPVLCKEYQDHDTPIATVQRPSDKDGWTPVGIIRAGESALVAAGYPSSTHVHVAEKRHNDADDPNHIGVGVYVSPEDLKRLQESPQQFYRERAMASFSSLIAFVLVLIANNALPKKMVWAGTVGSQKGCELVVEFREFLKTLGCDLHVDIARLNYKMSGPPHPYYLQSVWEKVVNNTLYKPYQISDGGDYGDLYNSPAHRILWPTRLSEAHINQLTDLAKRENISGLASLLWTEQEFDVEYAIELRNAIVDALGLEKRWLLGEILTGQKYTDTRGV